MNGTPTCDRREVLAQYARIPAWLRIERRVEAHDHVASCCLVKSNSWSLPDCAQIALMAAQFLAGHLRV